MINSRGVYPPLFFFYISSDVYLCSGQSNMEFTVNAVVNATTEVQNANNYPNKQ